MQTVSFYPYFTDGMQMMKKVLVAGATGYLGRFVVKEFKSRGYWIRALARSPQKLEHRGRALEPAVIDQIDEVFEGEVTKPESLQGICDDIDIVFSSIGITRQRDNVSFMDVDYRGNKNLLEEAGKANVSKFIYVSVFDAENMQNLKSVQAKLKFAERLRESKLAYSIIRPDGFFADMLEYLHMAEKGKAYVFGSGENKINPIHGEDLASVCADAVTGNAEEISVGGPEILTHNEMVKIAFETLGKTAKLSRIPIWLGTGILTLLRLFTSAKTYGPIEFFMTVMAKDMVAPIYGEKRLKDFFQEVTDNALNSEPTVT